MHRCHKASACRKGSSYLVSSIEEDVIFNLANNLDQTQAAGMYSVSQVYIGKNCSCTGLYYTGNVHYNDSYIDSTSLEKDDNIIGNRDMSYF